MATTREPIPVCPTCDPDYPRVYRRTYGQFKGEWLCSGCGAYLIEGEWIKECDKCGARVDQLGGLFVPHLCMDCLEAIREEQRQSGARCGICGALPIDCCC